MLKELVARLKAELLVEQVWLFGSFARGEIHEGSDIDLLVVGRFEERFHLRPLPILEMTDLPVEPLVYTRREFEAMKAAGNPFIMEVVRTGRML